MSHLIRRAAAVALLLAAWSAAAFAQEGADIGRFTNATAQRNG
jgi:parvulin-like peptidyl-prolyl isomerase